MLFLIHVKLKKPHGMSNKEFFSAWQRESVAGREQVASGAPVYKVAGKYEVVAIVDVPSAAALDEEIHALPIWQEGYQSMADVEITALRPYTEWGEQLDRLAAEA
jgi:muconolactone delta-isomerase